MKNQFLAFIAMLFISSTVTAATAVIDSDVLMGFDNIMVEGDMYNVRFDGDYDYLTMSYNELFAFESSQALFNTFMSTSIYTTAINGCGFTLSQSPECNVKTIASISGPATYGSFVSEFSMMVYFSQIALPVTRSFTTLVNSDIATYTKWTNVSAVPIPAAAFMFAPALLGFMGLRRKAKNSVA